MNCLDLKSSLMDLLGQYHSVLAFLGEPLVVTDRAVHHIRLKADRKPLYIPAYHVPHSKKKKTVDKMVCNTLEQGVIQESHSPWNSPLFLVPKYDGTFRPVINSCRVNAVTLHERLSLTSPK